MTKLTQDSALSAMFSIKDTFKNNISKSLEVFKSAGIQTIVMMGGSKDEAEEFASNYTMLDSEF